MEQIKKPTIICIANEKGGVAKTTSASRRAFLQRKKGAACGH